MVVHVALTVTCGAGHLKSSAAYPYPSPTDVARSPHRRGRSPLGCAGHGGPLGRAARRRHASAGGGPPVPLQGAPHGARVRVRRLPQDRARGPGFGREGSALPPGGSAQGARGARAGRPVAIGPMRRRRLWRRGGCGAHPGRGRAVRHPCREGVRGRVARRADVGRERRGSRASARAGDSAAQTGLAGQRQASGEPSKHGAPRLRARRCTPRAPMSAVESCGPDPFAAPETRH